MATVAQAELLQKRKTFAASLTIGLFVVLCVALCYSMTQFTAGKFIYPMDDTYIGMAMAKHLAMDGVWGITSHSFSSSTSSPIFVLLLAGCYWMTGPNEWWPLALSSLFAVASLAVTHRLLRNVSSPVRLAAVLGVAVLVPLHVMAVIGMEHTLHVGLSILFLHKSAKLIADDQALDWKLPAITAAMVGVRYEGLFAAGIVCAILLGWKRKPVESIIVLLAAAAPVVLYGLVASVHGWYWLPNSLLLKGSFWNYRDPRIVLVWAFVLFNQLRAALWLVPVLLALATGIVALRHSKQLYTLAAVVITLFAMLLHLLYARTGWVYRYEGYLIAMAIVALALVAEQMRTPHRIIFGAIVAVAVVGLSVRTVWAMGSLPIWSASIYAQQYQTARFLSRYYPRASVAANDIGAINYFTDLECLDLVGLADMDVLRARQKRLYSTAFMEAEALKRGVEIAVVYDAWFSAHPTSEFGGPPIPRNWIRVGRWKVPDFGILGSDTVSFYAVQPGAEIKLSKSLAAFSAELPKMVIVNP